MFAATRVMGPVPGPSGRGGGRNAPPPARATVAPSSSTIDLGARLRPDFPILDQLVHGDKPLVYLDSAATSQKPKAVLDTLIGYYGPQGYNSNVHRGVHALSAHATTAYEEARTKIARFVGASSDREIVFTRNASEAINLVANTWGTQNLGPGDEVILSEIEHHSNLVPWQLLAARTGCVLKFATYSPTTGGLDLDQMKSLITPKTKLISLVHVSNMLGCVLPVADVVEMAKSVHAKVLLDACQSVPNRPLDVSSLGVDWIVASGHKMLAPTGIGFLWGKSEVLAEMPPWMGGGEMIQDVSLDTSTFAEPPGRFEAGTPAIGEAIALGAACDYLMEVPSSGTSKKGMAAVHDFEMELGGYLHQELSRVDGVTIYGPSHRDRAALAAFNVDGLHGSDVAAILDQAGVAIRSGHHCTQPAHAALGINASARASLYLYNTPGDVDALVAHLKDTIKFFREAGL